MGRSNTAWPWAAVIFAGIVTVVLPIAGIPVGLLAAAYAQSRGAATARNVALLVTVIAVVLLVASGAGGGVSGGFAD